MRGAAILRAGLAAGVGLGCGDNGARPIDAPAVVVDAPVTDAFVLTGNVLYLDFSGGMITRGTHDAPATDVSSIAQLAGTLPAWVGSASTTPQMVEDAVSAGLAAFAVQLVTTPPAGEPYDHVVFGGKPSTLFGGGAITDLELFSAGPIDCIAHDPHLMFVFEQPWGGAADIANSVIGMLGLANGIPPSDTPGDCMCISDAPCTPIHAACSYDTSAMVGSAGSACANGDTTFDDHAAFLTTFGAH